MKVHFNKTDDTLMIELAKKKIDDAYETGSMIVHVAEDKEPVLLEVFHATKFLKDLNKSLPQSTRAFIFS